MSKKNQIIHAETIITSHINADFDAIASMLAAQKMYPESVIIFPGSQEKNLRDFFIQSTSYLFNMADPAQIDFDAVRKLVLVDTRQPSRLTQVKDLLNRKGLKIDIYDHHPDMEGDIRGDLEVIRSSGATASIMCECLREKEIRLTPEEATVLAAGIYEDTGNFTYSSTTPEDLEHAAYLISCGASLSTIVSLVVKEIRSDQVTWLNELLNEIRVHEINGVDVHISAISSNTYISDLAAIVQKVVRMENPDLYFAIVLMGNKVHIIARNQLPEVDVGKILSAFDGGGHAYAASAKIDNQTLAQVEINLIERLSRSVKAVRMAKTLMSAPAITIDQAENCEAAGAMMTRYNVSTLLVTEGEQRSYQGYITRRVIEKAMYHQLAHLPVTEYMNSDGRSVSSAADIASIEQLIIEEKNQILPVIDANEIKGVITRTDLLNYLVQHNKTLKNSQTELGISRNARTRQIKNVLHQRLDSHIRRLLEDIGTVGESLGYNMYVVGGFVRDLLLSRPVDDIDVVVEGDGIHFAKVYAKKNGCHINTYKKFGTAVIIFPDKLKVDVASARLEYYKTAASLPIVEKSSIKLDLARRDFTINTLAVSINPDSFGTMIDYFGANRDLKDQTIRIIHNLSFVEDPTRIFRAIKFSNRFDFRIGKVTENLIRNAIKIDSFKNLSGLRVLSELKQIFEEDNPIPAIRTMQTYGLEKVIHEQLEFIPKTYQLLESVNKTLSWHDLLYVEEEYPRWAVYFMAMLNRCSYQVCDQICTRLKVPVRERTILMEKRYKAEKLLNAIENAPQFTSQDLYWALINYRPEFILYMMALAKDEETRKAISHFYTHQRRIKTRIRGRDLIEIGVKPGPVFTEIMKEILNQKLEGRLSTRKKEIEFAADYAAKNKLID